MSKRKRARRRVAKPAEKQLRELQRNSPTPIQDIQDLRQQLLLMNARERTQEFETFTTYGTYQDPVT